MPIADGGDAFSTYGETAGVGLAAGVTMAGRVHAEAQMVSAGTISRRIGTTEDPDSREPVPVWEEIYSGKCKIKFPASKPNAEAIPGAIVTQQSPELHIPVEALGSGDVTVDDVFECTGNPLDTSLVGVKFRITGKHHGTYMTARRFPVEETS